MFSRLNQNLYQSIAVLIYRKLSPNKVLKQNDFAFLRKRSVVVDLGKDGSKDLLKVLADFSPVKKSLDETVGEGDAFAFGDEAKVQLAFEDGLELGGAVHLSAA